jgi:hypothetical protein
VAYSQNKSKAQIVGRFSPGSNPEHRPTSSTPEIDLLIATDVLSEGLNLQDCNQIINYDLHWNPVRLIQRFGRIDRIGTAHDQIFGFNFLPETELERNLGLREKLSRRIQEIHQTIGEDAAILDPGEQINEEAFYAIYRDGKVDRFEEDGDDEFVDLNEAEQVIRQLQEHDPATFEQISHLRDGILCERQFDYAQASGVVLCRAGSYRQLYLVNEAGDIISQDIPAILGLLKCEPDTPARPLPAGHNQRVMAIKQKFSEVVQARRAEQRHAAALTLGQHYVLRELRALFSQVDDEDLRAKITLFEGAFRAPVSEAVRTELNTLRRAEVGRHDLLAVLERLYIRHNLREAAARHTASIESDDLPIIVCSEGIIGTAS